MKNLLNLNGAQKLSKNEQQSINGGDIFKSPQQISCELQGGTWHCYGNVDCVCLGVNYK